VAAEKNLLEQTEATCGPATRFLPRFLPAPDGDNCGLSPYIEEGIAITSPYPTPQPENRRRRGLLSRAARYVVGLLVGLAIVFLIVYFIL
jgi:hypothetical protein